ncbi:MAG: hypothetical protein RL160_987 [Bacteroidota bacterium]|jgi:hypothetical protein
MKLCSFTGCRLGVAAGILAALSLLPAHAQEGLVLKHSFVNPKVAVPGLIYAQDFIGFTVEGHKLAFLHRQKTGKGPKYTVHTVATDGTCFRRKPESLLFKGQSLPNVDVYEGQVQMQQQRLLLVADSVLQVNSAKFPALNLPKGTATGDKYFMSADGSMVFGHFAYPYADGPFESGVIRYRLNSLHKDTTWLPRGHMYLTRSKFDNALCALWGDSTLLMTDIVNYKIYALNPHGPAHLVYEAKPKSWNQYPDSLEAEYISLEFAKGMMTAWDTMANWMGRYSRVEKIMANQRGDVVVRYTLYEEGQQIWALDFLKKEGTGLRLDTSILVRNAEPFGYNVKLLELTMLRTGGPTFLMDDGSIMALGIAAGKETMLGKTPQELMRFVTEKLPKSKKNMAVYVFERN